MLKDDNNFSVTKIVPDTSVLVDGNLSELLTKNGAEGIQIYIPEAVIAELESQANRNNDTGYNGLDELKKLKKVSDNSGHIFKTVGCRPTLEQVKLVRGGEIDAMIRDEAENEGATLVTSDKVQALVAQSKGLSVLFIKPNNNINHEKLKIEDFFTENTMSVHLKKDVPPMAKHGSIDDIQYTIIRDEPCTYKELESISKQLTERAYSDPEAFIEMSNGDSKVYQIDNMRISVTSPPFSDDFEITAVRPVASLDLENYEISDDLKNRIIEQRGILIAGPPGAGKSTFAAGVAKYLNNHGHVVKTMESPRDLQVPKQITQYSPLNDDMENTADHLLLVRPDYTIYDEVRKTKDFHIFADMRFAGVGMVGVVHAFRAVDAIQRLIGRIELGVIPQIVDTIIFIEKGGISKIQKLEFTVKIPEGMIEQDLARPVIQVSDYETNTTEFELYTYGEQVVVMPLESTDKDAKVKLAEGSINEIISQYVNCPFTIDLKNNNKVTVKLPKNDRPKLIGKGGSIISEIEKKLGLSIDVRDIEEEQPKLKNGDIYYPQIERSSKHLILSIPELASEDVEIYIDDGFLFSATISKNGEIKAKVDTPIAQSIINAKDQGKNITVLN